MIVKNGYRPVFKRSKYYLNYIVATDAQRARFWLNKVFLFFLSSLVCPKGESNGVLFLVSFTEPHLPH